MTDSTSATKPPKGRSPSYPGIDLQAAIQRAREIYESPIRTHPVTVSAITDQWGYAKPTTGMASVTLSALKKFGLLKHEGSGPSRKAKLSPLALEILMKPDPSHAIRSAALRPAIHKELFDRYGADLPEGHLRYELIGERGFTESGFTDFLREYRATMAFANPVPTDKIEDTEDPDPEGDDGDDEIDQGRGQRRKRKQRPGVVTYAVPLRPGADIVVEFPFAPSEDDFDFFLGMLNMAKPRLLAQPDARDED
jgi:hypothetical protein